MTDRFFKELIKEGKNKKVFQILDNGEWVVCDNIAILPLNDTTLGKYLIEKENAYNSKIEALEKRCEKQEAIINELVKAIKTMNGGV